MKSLVELANLRGSGPDSDNILEGGDKTGNTIRIRTEWVGERDNDAEDDVDSRHGCRWLRHARLCLLTLAID